ncbi:MAG TPA: FGGY family carbohydrate kinase, partial [Vicinamibacterales bacterium]|nr:FGGY family carbohydrate kinase [Vicinamibacterales bacterium]
MPVLGIDIGTGGTRAIVVDRAGAILASATSVHAPFRSPGPAWAEQDPSDWWRAAVEAVHAVLATGVVAAADIEGIGLSGQMHGAVLLDEDGEVLRPSIIWCDQRTAEECRWLDREVGPARLLELTSNPAL